MKCNGQLANGEFQNSESFPARMLLSTHHLNWCNHCNHLLSDIGDIVGDSVCREGVLNLVNIPSEVWRTRIVRLLSLGEICMLDSALLNHSLRSSLLVAFIDAEIEDECILSPDSINWLKSKTIKPLRVKLVVDINEEELLQFTQYCPQLVSLSTWDFEDDAQDVLVTSRKGDDNDATYPLRVLSETAIITILQRCTHLKTLQLCEMIWADWCDTFVHIVPHCAHVDEIDYQKPEFPGSYSDQYFHDFALSRTSWIMDTCETLPAAVLTAVATHFVTLTSLHLVDRRGNDPALDAAGEAGLLELARCCVGLNRVIFGIRMSNATLIEFCRLCPHLVELQLDPKQETADYAAAVVQALQHVPGVQVFCCYSKMEEQLLRGIADAQPQFRVIGVPSASLLPIECWEYVLGKCTKLRTILSEAGRGTSRLRALAALHSVGVEQGDRGGFYEPA